MYRILLTVLIALTAGLAEAEPRVTQFTQQDPAYQQHQEHLSRAATLLKRAEQEMEAAEKTWQMPGFRYDLALEDLAWLREQLDFLLIPEQRRYRHQPLVPEGDFMETPEPARPDPDGVPLRPGSEDEVPLDIPEPN